MYPESNSRVKVAKRLIRDNTGPARNLNTKQDLLQYLNIPLRGLAEFLR